MFCGLEFHPKFATGGCDTGVGASGMLRDLVELFRRVLGVDGLFGDERVRTRPFGHSLGTLATGSTVDFASL